MKYLQAVVATDNINHLILNTQFTAEHFIHIKKLYNKYKDLKHCSCVNYDPSGNKECPYVDGCSCGSAAELVTGRNNLNGNGCFAVIQATYEWAKTQKFTRFTKI